MKVSKSLKATQNEIANLTNYFKSIINIYKDTHNKTISRFSFSTFYNLPLILSDRIYYAILDVNNALNHSPKRDIIDKLVEFYLGDSVYQRKKILKFLDFQSKGEIIKKDIKLFAIYFISFLKYTDCDREQIMSIIEEAFKAKERIYYDNNSNMIENSHLSYVINLFHHFLFQSAPLDEYSNYIAIVNKKTFDDKARRGADLSSKNLKHPFRCNSSHFLSMRYNSCSCDWNKSNWGDEALEYELCFQEGQEEDIDSIKNNNGSNLNANEYNCLSFKDIYTLKNDISKKVSIEIKKKYHQKKISYERYPSIDTLSTTTDENSDVSMIDYSNSSTYMKEYSFQCKEQDCCDFNGDNDCTTTAADFKKYKFMLNDKYIYYSSNKKRKELIPITSTYTEDIQATIIVKKKYYQMSIIVLCLFEHIKLNLYSYSKEDLLKFKKEHKQYSNYKHINDYYEFGREIGKGKFAIVYLGTNILTKSNVAIKKIGKKICNEHQIEMLHKEYDIFKFLILNPHPNIAKGIEYFESIDYAYFVYEYIPNSIASYNHNTTQPYDLFERNTQYIKQLVKAINHLHSYGIIHRDIKPENILIDHNDNIKLIDFGLGTIITSNETMKNQCGTLICAAPEILGTIPYGKKCDIWSLGIVAYYLVYGFYPFEGNSIQEIKEKIIKGTYCIPALLNRSASINNSQLDSLIEKCLIVNNDLRIDLNDIMIMLI